MRRYNFELLVLQEYKKDGCWRGEVWLNGHYIYLLEDFETEQALCYCFFEMEDDFRYHLIGNEKLFEAFFAKENFLH